MNSPAIVRPTSLCGYSSSLYSFPTVDYSPTEYKDTSQLCLDSPVEHVHASHDDCLDGVCEVSVINGHQEDTFQKKTNDWTKTLLSPTDKKNNDGKHRQKYAWIKIIQTYFDQYNVLTWILVFVLVAIVIHLVVNVLLGDHVTVTMVTRLVVLVVIGMVFSTIIKNDVQDCSTEICLQHFDGTCDEDRCTNRHYELPFQVSTLREEPRQINVILQQKLLAAKLSAICTIYKQ